VKTDVKTKDKATIRIGLWLVLLCQILVAIVYTLVSLGYSGGIDFAIIFFTNAALNLTPGDASSLVFSVSDFVLTYWFFSLAVIFSISVICVSVLVLFEKSTSTLRRALWLLSFFFFGFFSIPVYCVIRLFAGAKKSHKLYKI
jgi:hypothetical protein